MAVWKNLRYLVLFLACSVTFLALGKTLIAPPPKRQPIATFNPPDRVLLAGWQQVKSEPLPDKTGKTYQYRRGSQQLTIEMHYTEGLESNGDLFIEHSPEIVISGEAKPVVRQQQNVGSYSLSTRKGQAYLRSCIPPQGEATILYGKFASDRYKLNSRVDRLWPWLSGQKPLLDYRCLWVHFSIPYKDQSPEPAYQLLETAWFTWYRQWHSQFPKS